jgi:hypothetical protein
MRTDGLSWRSWFVFRNFTKAPKRPRIFSLHWLVYSVFERRTSVSIPNQSKSYVSLYCYGWSLQWTVPLTEQNCINSFLFQPVQNDAGSQPVSYSRADEPMARVPNRPHGKISLAHSIHCCPPFLYFFRPTSVSVWWRTCVYIHTSDCVQTIWIIVAAFWLKSVAARNVHWIFIIGAPAWWWMGESMKLYKTFYSVLFKQEVSAIPGASTFSSLSYSSRRQDWNYNNCAMHWWYNMRKL